MVVPYVSTKLESLKFLFLSSSERSYSDFQSMLRVMILNSVPAHNDSLSFDIINGRYRSVQVFKML